MGPQKCTAKARKNPITCANTGGALKRCLIISRDETKGKEGALEGKSQGLVAFEGQLSPAPLGRPLA